ncbi:MAG: hypothetical protein PSX36_12860 [bacterium]|nr:hypothetical protein [bacterium]
MKNCTIEVSLSTSAHGDELTLFMIQTNNKLTNHKSSLIGPYSLEYLKIKEFFKKSRYSESEPQPEIKITGDVVDITLKKLSGIYVWGIKVKGEYLPLYVGKSINIPERLFQHIIRFCHGEYIIPEWTLMANAQRNIHVLKSYYLTNDVLPKGLLYYPSGVFDFDSIERNPRIKSTMKKFRVGFFACWKYLPDYKNTARFQEDALASALGKERLISSHRKLNTESTLFISDFLKLLH